MRAKKRNGKGKGEKEPAGWDMGGWESRGVKWSGAKGEREQQKDKKAGYNFHKMSLSHVGMEIVRSLP
jgi:hypothetical protein